MEADDYDEEEEGEQGKGGGMVGFMFGNVDNNLQLEKDSNYIEDEAKSHLNALEGKGLGLQLGAQDADQGKTTKAKQESGVVRKPATAVNYEDIDELAEDAPVIAAQSKQQLIAAALKPAEGGDDDYDDDYDGDDAPPAPPSDPALALPTPLEPRPLTTALPGVEPVQTSVPGDAPLAAMEEPAAKLASAPPPPPAPPVPVAPTAEEIKAEMERHVRAGAGGECDDHSVPSQLPVLYKEADGSSVLKFSELFAPLRAVDPLNGQMHPRALRKRYLRMIRLQKAAGISAKPADEAEDDAEHEHELEEEAAYLDQEQQASSSESEEDEAIQLLWGKVRPTQTAPDEGNIGQSARPRFSAYQAALPLASDPGAMSEEQEAKRKRDEEALEPHLAPVHQCAWEEDILWGDGDDDGDSDGEPAAKPGSFLGGGALQSENHARRKMSSMAAARALCEPLGGNAPRPSTPPLEESSSAQTPRKPRHFFHARHLRLERGLQEEAISTEAVLEGDASTPKKEPEPKPVEAAASTVTKRLECRGAVEVKSEDSALQASKDLRQPYASLVDDDWLDQVIWDDVKPHRVGQPVRLDLKDPNLVLQVADSSKLSYLQSRVAAVLLPAPCARANNLSDHAQRLSLLSEEDRELERFFIEGGAEKNEKKDADIAAGGQGVGFAFRPPPDQGVIHSLPAMKLTTTPPHLKSTDHLHKPIAYFTPPLTIPKKEKTLSIKGMAKYTLSIRSLGDAKPLTIEVMKDKPARAVQSIVLDKWSRDACFEGQKGKWAAEGNEPCLVLISPTSKSNKGTRLVLNPNQTLAKQGVTNNSTIYLVSNKVWPLSTRTCLAAPGKDKPTRPPAAFKRKGDLTGTDGRIVLIEHSEEHPFLMNIVGMGAKLVKYYQRKAHNDFSGKRFASQDGPALEELNPNAPSPFIGSLAPGATQLSVETRMYRAPAFAHAVNPTDFMLIRRACGRVFLREISFLATMGLQEPMLEVFTPNSEAVQKYQEKRLQVYVYRHFRQKQTKNEVAVVRIQDLNTKFTKQSETLIRKKIKHCADFQRVGDFAGQWALKEGFELPSEEQLRRMVTPEDVCSFEATQVGVDRLHQSGITAQLVVTATPSQLASAVQQLPQDPQFFKAAEMIETGVLQTSWSQTGNFMAAISGRGVLEVAGHVGNSIYIRKSRAPEKKDAAQVPKKEVPSSGTVTGTNADLRRLSMDAAATILRRLGVQDDEVATLSRWERIALVRSLSSAAAADGSHSGLGRFARGTRTSMAQQAAAQLQAHTEAFSRQLSLLAHSDRVNAPPNHNPAYCQSKGEGSDGDEDGDDMDMDGFADDLENMLEEDGSGEASPPKKSKNASKKKPVENEEENEEEALKELQQMMAEDKVKAKQGETHIENVSTKPKKEKRLQLRRITTQTKPDGSTVIVQQDIITNPQIVSIYLKTKEAGTNPVAALAAAEGLVSTDPQKGRGSVRIMSAVEEARLAEERRIRRREQEKERRKRCKLAAMTPQKRAQVLAMQAAQAATKAKRERSARAPPPSQAPTSNLVCGGCGGKGHMRTSRECPLNRAKDGPDPSANKPLNKLLKIKLGGAKLGIESLNKGKHGNPQPTALVPLTNKKKALGINGSTGVRTEPSMKPMLGIKAKIVWKRPGASGMAIASGSSSIALTHTNSGTPPRHGQKRSRSEAALDTSREGEAVSLGITMDKTPPTIKTVRGAGIGRGLDVPKIGIRLGDATAKKKISKGNGESAKKSKPSKPAVSPLQTSSSRQRVRRTEGSGLVQLNNLLLIVVEDMMKMRDFWPFFSPVPTAGRLGVKDYVNFVKTPLSMKEMKNRCNNTMYNSVQEFKNDIEQICANARAYNNPENLGKFGDPFLITVAENFQAAVHQVLDIKAAELSDAECLVRGENP